MDSQAVCYALKISGRTLQYYRSRKLIPYSLRGKKVYYKTEDVIRFARERSTLNG